MLCRSGCGSVCTFRYLLFLPPVPHSLSCIDTLAAQPWLCSGLPLPSPLPTPHLPPLQAPLQPLPPAGSGSLGSISCGPCSLQPHTLALYPFRPCPGPLAAPSLIPAHTFLLQSLAEVASGAPVGALEVCRGERVKFDLLDQEGSGHDSCGAPALWACRAGTRGGCGRGGAPSPSEGRRKQHGSPLWPLGDAARVPSSLLPACPAFPPLLLGIPFLLLPSFSSLLLFSSLFSSSLFSSFLPFLLWSRLPSPQCRPWTGGGGGWEGGEGGSGSVPGPEAASGCRAGPAPRPPSPPPRHRGGASVSDPPCPRRWRRRARRTGRRRECRQLQHRGQRRPGQHLGQRPGG